MTGHSATSTCSATAVSSSSESTSDDITWCMADKNTYYVISVCQASSFLTERMWPKQKPPKWNQASEIRDPKLWLRMVRPLQVGRDRAVYYGYGKRCLDNNLVMGCRPCPATKSRTSIPVCALAPSPVVNASRCLCVHQWAIRQTPTKTADPWSIRMALAIRTENESVSGLAVRFAIWVYPARQRTTRWEDSGG